MHVVGKNCMHMASMRAVLRSTLVCLALTSGSSPRRAIVGSSTSQSPSQMEHLQIPAPTLSRGSGERYNLLSLLGQFVIPFVSARISDVSGILIHR